MLKHVQHKDQRKILLKAQSLFKPSDMDPTTMRVAFIEQGPLRLDSFNISESQKLIEEQSVSTADIEDSFPSVWRLVLAKSLQDEMLTGPPPPMPLVEFAISCSVVATHL
jgi:hypothetical protein